MHVFGLGGSRPGQRPRPPILVEFVRQRAGAVSPKMDDSFRLAQRPPPQFGGSCELGVSARALSRAAGVSLRIRSEGSLGSWGRAPLSKSNPSSGTLNCAPADREMPVFAK